MKSTRLTVALLLLVTTAGLVGCGGSPEKKLIGKWDLDTAALTEAIKAKAGDNPGAAMGMAMMSSMKVVFEFKEENAMSISISMGGIEKSENGKWEVVSSSGKSITIKMESPDPTKGTKSDELTLTFVDDDTIEMKPPKSSNMDVDKVTLRRVKE